MSSDKPFAVFDIDGTIFRSSLLIELSNQLMKNGLFPKIVGAEIELAHQAWLKREVGDAYETYLMTIVKAYEKHIRGVSETQLKLISENVIDEMHRHTYIYTRDLVEKLRETHFLIAISGSPTELVEKFVKRYKFDAYKATEYEIVDGVYTGKFTKANTDKDQILASIVEENILSYENSYGVGDTNGDVALLSAVDNPIAFNPDAELKSRAMQNKWDIVVERKSEIYRLKESNGSYILD